MRSFASPRTTIKNNYHLLEFCCTRDRAKRSSTMRRPARGEAGQAEEGRMRTTGLGLLAVGLVAATAVEAQVRKNGPGVTDSEITIGQSAPFSGPASAFGIYSRVEEAYFRSLNDK